MSSQQIIGKNYRNQVRQRSAWRDSPEFSQWFYFSTRQSEEQQKPVTSLMLTLKMTRQTEMNMQSNSMTSETTPFFWELGTPKPSHPSLSLSILPRSRTSSSSISITLCVLSVEVEHYNLANMNYCLFQSISQKVLTTSHAQESLLHINSLISTVNWVNYLLTAPIASPWLICWITHGGMWRSISIFLGAKNREMGPI